MVWVARWARQEYVLRAGREVLHSVSVMLTELVWRQVLPVQLRRELCLCLPWAVRLFHLALFLLRSVMRFWLAYELVWVRRCRKPRWMWVIRM